VVVEEGERLDCGRQHGVGPLFFLKRKLLFFFILFFFCLGARKSLSNSFVKTHQKVSQRRMWTGVLGLSI
jgi:hypothetical protein